MCPEKSKSKEKYEMIKKIVLSVRRVVGGGKNLNLNLLNLDFVIILSLLF